MANLMDSDSLKAQAMVLAAGRGERMRPLTDHTPKPLLKVKDTCLIEWTLQGLQKHGYTKVLINTAWLGQSIRRQLGTSYSASTSHVHAPMQLVYSSEELDFGAALETAGGIVRALPLLSDPFWVVAADVYCPSFDFDPVHLTALQNSPFLGQIWLVKNPPHHPQGDFCKDAKGLAALPRSLDALEAFEPTETLTFSTIGIYKHSFFQTFASELAVGNPLGIKAPLGPVLKRGIQAQSLLASNFREAWTDVGTPERLAMLNS
jgi:MurNAc alpha-1-phosphate uridylyltransferase